MSISPTNFVNTEEESVKLFANKLNPTLKRNLIRMSKAQVFNLIPSLFSYRYVSGCAC